MEPLPPPTLETELSGVYTDEEKGQILQQIESAAGAGRLTVEDEVFKARKSGILFPVLVNVAAVALIAGGWFGANAYFQTKQEGLKQRTDKLFSAESTLLAKVMEDSKAKIAQANAEIDKIQGDLTKAAAEKADLQRSFEDRVAAQDKALRAEMAAALDAEKKRLQATGLSENEVSQRLVAFESTKNIEFNNKLDTYRKQAQTEIDQRTIALTSLQAKLQTTVSEQEKLRQDVEKQTKEREGALQSQLSSQNADIDALKKEKDDLNAYFRQSDAVLGAVRSAFEARDWDKARTAVDALKTVLAKGNASVSEAVRARAQSQDGLLDAFDNALGALQDTSSKTESQAQLETVKAQAKKDLAAAAAQLAESQQATVAAQQAGAASESRWKQSAAEADALRGQVAHLQTSVDELVGKLNGSSDETFQARVETQALETQIDTLQAQIAALTPYKERSDALSKLFAASYPSAEERFKATFGSAVGAAQFPTFDQAWTELSEQIANSNDAKTVRQKAFADVVTFTTYLRGLSTNASQARDTVTRLSRSDEAYRSVVENIQSLASSGTAESNVSTAATQLYGTVAAVGVGKLVLEPLTKVRPQVGQTVEIRRVVGRKETVLGSGAVLTAAANKVEIEWTATTVPLSGDAAYLVLN